MQTNTVKELFDNLEKLSVLEKENEERKKETTDLKSSIQAINKDIRQIRYESNAENLKLFINNITNRVNSEIDKMQRFFIDIKKRVFPTEITNEMLKDVIDRSNTKYKELTVVVGYAVDDLATISKLINNENRDAFKRWQIYNFCNQKLGEIIKTDKVEVTID